MKNKSTRHKDYNTFKFLPFAERISNIDIDVFHKVEHEYETQQEGSESHFYQVFDKWNVLNLTEGYETFRKEIRWRDYVTLPQVLFGKERIIEILTKHLKQKDSAYLQPLLEILVAFVKDLQKEFYPYYPQFLDILIDILNTKETEQLEWTFTCLAYLFKLLWRPLVKDIGIVFKALLPLLSDTKPEYINDFAAESFAFVARKVKDKKYFLEVLLKAVKHNRDGVVGCGKLLFHVINGIEGQFHSCAQILLPFLFKSLGDEQLPQQMLFEILESLVQNLILNIHPQKNGLYWETLIEITKKLIEKSRFDTAELLLKIMGQSMEYKAGRFLQKPSLIIDLLLNLLNEDLPQSAVLASTQIGILLLTSKNLKVPQDQASLLTKKLLNVKFKSVLLYFIENICEYSSFEALILTTFLKYVVNNEFDVESFLILVKIVMKKSPPSRNGIMLEKWKKYPLDFKENTLKFSEKLLEMVNGQDNIENYFFALFCLPHLVKIDSETNDKIVEYLERAMDSLLGVFDENKFLLLNFTVECLIHVASIDKLVGIFKQKILPFILHCPPSYNSLCLISLCLTALNDIDGIITVELLMDLNKLFEENFTSPYHEVRLVTSHVYMIFERLDFLKKLKHTTDPDVPAQEFRLFTIIYEIECADPQIDTYRNQLQNLEKLNYDKPQIIMCNQTVFKTVPLRFLCGILYVNFRLIWDPVIKIIASYANGMNVNEFWEVFGIELKKVCDKIKNLNENKLESMEVTSSFLNDYFMEIQTFASKPDFVNYRILLWKSLGLFPNVAEVKTRDTSELLLDFIEKEYFKTDSEASPIFNIKIHSNEENELENNVESSTSKPGLNRKICTKTLHEKLKVFSQIKSPLSMYKQPELYKLYYDLLQHKDPSIQQLALACIMTYKFKYLTPYKEELTGLVDDKNFKHVLLNFNLNPENGNVSEEHRKDLIPIVMQIVFGKMNAKTGLRTGGKASGQTRRNLVFKFLAGCKEEEMLMFLRKTLKFYDKYSEVEADTIELDKFLPPKRLLSTVNLLKVVFDQFGGLMSNEILSYLLKILFTIGMFLKAAFDQIEKVHVGYMPTLKNLRASCIGILIKFLQTFDNYPWSFIEIDVLFQLFVWDSLGKLHIENVNNPTNLLKLIAEFGANPKYFPLLIKRKEGNDNFYILAELVKLLTNPKCSNKVTEIIEEVIEHLLKLAPEEENPQLQVNNLLEIEIIDNFNYGSCILLPKLGLILEMFKRKLAGKNRNLNDRELLILSRLTELVTESDLSDALLHLFLPVTRKKCKHTTSEDVVIKYYTTALNLIKNVPEPKTHLKEISPLFGETCWPSCRKLLCQILETASDEFELIQNLNAWDKKWVDQPDYEKRHEAFKEIQLRLQEDRIDLTLGIILSYNFYFLIRSEKDLALKENASYNIKKLSVHLVKNNPKQLDYILNDTLLRLIKTGINTNNDDLRNECILLLGTLARECNESHYVLRDLHSLTDKNDPEVDFFENLTHLQLHRHARALLKYCTVLRELKTTPNPKSLTQFILPLASHYLLKEKFAGKNAVIDGCIEAVGSTCRVLPWHQYENVLRFYLEKLSSKVGFQKQLVRLVVAILDAFHFDLSKGNCNDIEGNNAKNQNQEEAGEERAKEENIDSFVEEVDESAEAEIEPVEPEETTNEINIYDKITILCRSTSIRVIRTIHLVLLPTLNKSLAELTHFESSHKVNRKKTSIEQEEEDLLRVPISLAMVKLLQKLPKKILDENVPGIFMKMCTFLKSHLESVRRVARETLQKIMLALGPKYLPTLLSEMSTLLNRGYQVHVLVFTVHGVLNSLKNHYKPRDIDRVLITVLNLCTADLFGVLAEEKEVTKIAVKTSEARHNKTYDTLQIVAQYITESCLLDLIMPIKNVLETTHSYKNIHKAEESLRFISLGLVDNEFISSETLMKFSYGIASESVPQLLSKKKQQISSEGKNDKQREDSLIIPQMPDNRVSYREQNVKTAVNINAYLLVEFGLRICLIMLKREKVQGLSTYIDPFVFIFQKCLNSNHVKLSTLTLQCLSWVFKYDLPSLRNNMKSITKAIFSILHKYASAGLCKGDNFDLIMSAFKAISVLLREVKYHNITTTQLKILLMYAEQDVHDQNKRATAFGLLRAILTRKINMPEIKDVMMKVAELSVTSSSDNVRVQCRTVFHQFVMDYPLENNLDDYLGFYLSQLGFELRYGRESAIEMVYTFINTFPMSILKNHCGSFLISLGARLMNDDEPECRKRIAQCIGVMLERLPLGSRNQLFEIVLLWFKDKNISHRQLAAQLCGFFVLLEKNKFEKRLAKLTPHILNQFGINNEPGRFVKLKQDNADETENEEQTQKTKDHHLFQILQLILKLCAHCPAFLKEHHILNDLAIHCQSLLNHPHDWVRLASTQFIGYALTLINPNHLSELILTNQSEEDGFLLTNPADSLKSLTLDLCDQLQPAGVKLELAEQVIKNLIFVAKVLQNLPIKLNEKFKALNLPWLAKLMRKIINTEIVENPTSTILRTAVFKWMAGVFTALNTDKLKPICHHFLAPLAREMLTTEEKNAPLRHLAKEVSNLIKSKIGMEDYVSLLSKLQQNLSMRRAERKRSRTQLAVTAPEVFAKKKIKRQEKKKVTKKRKIDQMKGVKRNFKKRKVVDLEEVM